MNGLRYFLLISLSGIFIDATAYAEIRCAVPVTELQAGVSEANFGEVRIKTEEYNKVAKMKLVSSLNEDWTSVSTESSIGKISGFYGNGDDAKLVAQFFILQTPNGFEWALFKAEGQGTSPKGTAYFYLDKQLLCAQTDLHNWDISVSKIIGNPANVGVVNISNDSL